VATTFRSLRRTPRVAAISSIIFLRRASATFKRGRTRKTCKSTTYRIDYLLLSEELYVPIVQVAFSRDNPELQPVEQELYDPEEDCFIEQFDVRRRSFALSTV
jgi:hypothetical protein